MEPALRTEACSATRIGDREENEDRVATTTAGRRELLVVADGMGGHEAGGEAAQAAVETMIAAFEAGGAKADPGEFLIAAFHDAQLAVARLGEGIHIDACPRTTCVAALVDGEQAWFAHLGDSRAYLLRDGAVVAQTRDHSHVEQLYRDGEISADERYTHPLRHLVERCLGGEDGDAKVEIGGPHELAPGDILLLCSDGFWEGLDMAAVGAMLHEADDLGTRLEGMVEAACGLHAPNADNATAAVLRVAKGKR